MQIINEINRIKKNMGLNESEEDEQLIINYEKNLTLAKKIKNDIIELLKQSLSDKLYNVSSDIVGVCFGSTQTKDGESYCGEKLKITLEFVNLSSVEEGKIRRDVFNLVESYTPFNLRVYMSPIDVVFINYTKKEF